MNRCKIWSRLLMNKNTILEVDREIHTIAWNLVGLLLRSGATCMQPRSCCRPGVCHAPLGEGWVDWRATLLEKDESISRWVYSFCVYIAFSLFHESTHMRMPSTPFQKECNSLFQELNSFKFDQIYTKRALTFMILN